MPHGDLLVANLVRRHEPCCCWRGHVDRLTATIRTARRPVAVASSTVSPRQRPTNARPRAELADTVRRSSGVFSEGTSKNSSAVCNRGHSRTRTPSAGRNATLTASPISTRMPRRRRSPRHRLTRSPETCTPVTPVTLAGAKAHQLRTGHRQRCRRTPGRGIPTTGQGQGPVVAVRRQRRAALPSVGKEQRPPCSAAALAGHTTAGAR